MRTKVMISNLQAKVEKLEEEGEQLRAQLEKKSPAKKAATSKLQLRSLPRKLLLRRPLRLVKEETKAK